MEPSSLVLVAIVGVWAAYLVPYWSRRREDLVQSRTGDRFSGGLRVLQRRRSEPRSSHRSGDPVLNSPRVVVDADGEWVYVPAERPKRSAPADAREGVAAAQAHPAGPASPRAASPGRPDAPRLAEGARSDMGRAAPQQPPRGVSDVTREDLDRALGAAHHAAHRRAVIMALLVVATVLSWGATFIPRVLAVNAIPATLLLVVHLMASRVAGVRSSRRLVALADELWASRAPDAAETPAPAAARRAEPAPQPAVDRPDRLARRAAAVTAARWEPVGVPAPMYTLKPAAHRPTPAPLEVPAASTARGRAPAASASRGSGVRTASALSAPALSGGPSASRGSLRRRPEYIERILNLDADEYQPPAAVNG